MQVPLERFQEILNQHQATRMPAAQDRYGQFSEIDPYPEIPAALLHAGHIASYIIATGMVDPFELSDLKKPATILIRLEGDVRYKDEDGRSQHFYLSDNPEEKKSHLRVEQQFCLKPNSLCYVTLRPTFRLPNYIGGRFNLMIRDVYRGLLVGTGPLVDPGFVGRLSIPVHNFTSTEYTLKAGEGFVYFEFTKLSSATKPSSKKTVPRWLPKPIAEHPPFPSDKNKRKTIDDYLQEATGSGPPQSVLASEIAAFQRLTKQHTETIDKYSTRVDRYTSLFKTASIVGAITFVVGIAALTYACWQLIVSVQDFARVSQQEAATEIKSIALDQKELSTRLQILGQEMDRLRNEQPAPLIDP